jgi:hypothetical protein
MTDLLPVQSRRRAGRPSLIFGRKKTETRFSPPVNGGCLRF